MNVTNQPMNNQDLPSSLFPSRSLSISVSSCSSLLLFSSSSSSSDSSSVRGITSSWTHHEWSQNTPAHLKICSLCTGQLLIISWRSPPHRHHPLVRCPAAHLEPKDSKNKRNVIKGQISDMKEQQICAKSNSLRFLYCGNVLFYPAHSQMISDERNTKQC